MLMYLASIVSSSSDLRLGVGDLEGVLKLKLIPKCFINNLQNTVLVWILDTQIPEKSLIQTFIVQI